MEKEHVGLRAPDGGERRLRVSNTKIQEGEGGYSRRMEQAAKHCICGQGQEMEAQFVEPRERIDIVSVAASRHRRTCQEPKERDVDLSRTGQAAPSQAGQSLVRIEHAKRYRGDDRWLSGFYMRMTMHYDTRRRWKKIKLSEACPIWRRGCYFPTLPLATHP